MNQNSKTTLITGTARGIGYQMIQAFAEKSYTIIAHARERTHEFEDNIKKITEQYDISVIPLYFDITDTESMKREINHLFKLKMKIDVLINNAGIAHGGLFAMTKVQTIQEIFNVNLFAHMELTQLLLRQMIRQKSGCIINMGSISGLDLHAGNSAYGVSKAALMAWTKTLAAEVSEYGIRVNALAPGLTDTHMATLMEKQAGLSMMQNSAMKRLAKPEEIAGIAVFLASEEASFINGQIIRADGGSI